VGSKLTVPPILPDGNGLAANELAKSQALDHLRARRGIFVRGQRALLNLLLDQDSDTIDDARDLVEVPDGINPKLFDAVPGPVVEAVRIAAAVHVRSRRRKARARPALRWLLVDVGAALDWLTDHPKLVAPGQPTLFT
jgi:hypothetical protein